MNYDYELLVIKKKIIEVDRKINPFYLDAQVTLFHLLIRKYYSEHNTNTSFRGTANILTKIYAKTIFGIEKPNLATLRRSGFSYIQ